MKIPVKSIIGISGIVIAVVWSIHGVNFREVSGNISNMDGALTVLVLILTTLNLVIRAMVWKFIVNPIKTVPFGNALSSYVLGVFSNLFLPFKLGDVAQGYSLGRKEDISKIAVVSTILLQRIFEFLSLLLILSIVALLFSFPLLFERRTLMFGLLIIASVSFLYLGFNKREKVVGEIEKFMSRFSPGLARKIGKSLELFLSGTKAIHNPKDIVWILSFSLLSWFVQVTMVWLTTHALGISVSLVSSAVILLVINIGLAIPLAPGNIGTFQFFSIIALSIFSISKSKALTFAVIFQIIQGIPVIIGGGLSFLLESFHSKRVKSEPGLSRNSKTEGGDTTL